MKGLKGRGFELYAVSNAEFKHILRFCDLCARTHWNYFPKVFTN